MQAVGDRRPVLLTFSGTGADMWTGYPADLAERVKDVFYHQPVNYPAATFPMGQSATDGVREAVRLVLDEHPDASGYGLWGYSQGGMCASAVLDEFRRAGGALKRFEDRLVVGGAFGNPWREVDANGGRGISDRRIVGTPAWWIEEFDPGDIYANVPNNAVGADMTAIFKLIQLRNVFDLIGAGTLVDRLGAILTGPLAEFPAAIEAAVKALAFFGSKPMCAAHVEYHLRQRPGTGVTYFEHAVAQVRRAGEQFRAAA